MTDYQTRQELNALSKDLFGASSRWQKLVNSGYQKLVTEETTEFVPDEAHPEGGTERKVQVPVKTASGAFQYTTERHTVESIRELMTKLKTEREERLAKSKKEREEKELQAKLQQELSGSAAL